MFCGLKQISNLAWGRFFFPLVQGSPCSAVQSYATLSDVQRHWVQCNFFQGNVPKIAGLLWPDELRSWLTALKFQPLSKSAPPDVGAPVLWEEFWILTQTSRTWNSAKFFLSFAHLWLLNLITTIKAGLAGLCSGMTPRDSGHCLERFPAPPELFAEEYQGRSSKLALLICHFPLLPQTRLKKESFLDSVFLFDSLPH